MAGDPRRRRPAGRTRRSASSAPTCPRHEETIDEALKPALEDLGYEVAAEAVLPCPEGSQTCEQHDVAIQRMQDAGVDFVFLVAQTLAGSATVEAAQNLGFEPQWATIGQQRHQHGREVLREREGQLRRRLWPRHRLPRTAPTRRPTCNEIAVAGGAEEFPRAPTATASPPSRACRCSRSPRPSTRVDGDVDQATVIAALEELGPCRCCPGRPGSLSADKHDAGHGVFLSRYSAETEEFEPVDDREADRGRRC